MPRVSLTLSAVYIEGKLSGERKEFGGWGFGFGEGWKRPRGEMGDAGDSGSLDQTVGSSSSHSSTFFTNYPLIAAIVAFTIAQATKFITSWYVHLWQLFRIWMCRYSEKRWDLKLLIGSGGMPSSHSATVSALAMAIGFQEGFGGSLFAAALILACVVMYDATGVRLQAGRQAEVLNQIVYELPAEHPLAESRPLRELLGHTPAQVVAGCLLGVVTAIIGHLITMTTSQS
ncbi:unnamed protein product [Linum tenue]|uniref:Acid phosphatase/vanadium-dependent haloperoxidase-related protein n=1 Tax=Linum tenue TaxID=586396 RepID=A0AAV0KVZ4_9ROSI|nr:unnamed protein product [Linum tenue]